MSVLFAHDGPVYSNDGENYYGIHFNDELRQRYLQLGNKVSFVMRVYQFNPIESSRLSRISNEMFSVISVPNFKSIRLYVKNKNRAKRIVEKAVLDHDVIIARMPSAIGTLAVRYANKYKKPLLVEYVACTFDAYWNYSWKGKLIAHYKMYQQKRIMRSVPYTIYVTEKFLQERYPTQGKSVSCSDVELPPLNETILDKRLIQINNLDWKNPLVLGTVAALDVPYKGQADVVRALAKLRTSTPNFKYLLVGQGDPSRLKQLIRRFKVENLVEIIGPLKHQDVFAFYDTLDVYIQPSKQEGLPRALIEAMSQGCPAFGARTAGIPELLDEAMIFEKGDIKGIVKKLQRIRRETLILEARKNFDTAAKYKKELLTRKRSLFYREFLEENNLIRDSG